MKLGARGEQLIKEFEGLRLGAYLDQAGIWTIGWGHTGPDARKGNRISQQRAQELFDMDNDNAENTVRRLNQQRVEPLTQLQFDALVSFEFNTGALSNRRNRVTQRVIEGRDDLVDDEMLRWVYVTDPKTKAKTVSNGLKRRRHAEAALWNEGVAQFAADLEPITNPAGDSTSVPAAPPTPAAEAAASPAVQGSAIATMSAVLATATEQIQPLAGFSDTLRLVFVCLALAGVALAVWGATKGRT